MNKNTSGYTPNIAVPPGETLKDLLDSQHMSQVDLATRLSLTPKTVNEIINGKAPITADTALKLEMIFKTPAQFWNALESNYQEIKARLDDYEKINSEIGILNLVPYKALAKLGWVPQSKDTYEMILNLRRFFGISTLKLIPTVQSVAFKVQENSNISSYAIASWLRIGELIAKGIIVDSFSEIKIKESIPKLRSLTTLSPDKFHTELTSICATCGIAVVTVPHLPSTYINGAVKWLNSKKALVQLSLRSSYADVFWFSFFHELGHVILHSKKQIFLESDDDNPEMFTYITNNNIEKEANNFAANSLIPLKDYSSFVLASDFSYDSIISFSNKVAIDPSVVVGRLQHDKYLHYTQYNDLRRKFRWKIATP